jgi:hypothetical protein
MSQQNQSSNSLSFRPGLCRSECCFDGLELFRGSVSAQERQERYGDAFFYSRGEIAELKKIQSEDRKLYVVLVSMDTAGHHTSNYLVVFCATQPQVDGLGNRTVVG